mgnify:CR=1 FL=1
MFNYNDKKLHQLQSTTEGNNQSFNIRRLRSIEDLELEMESNLDLLGCTGVEDKL